MFNKFNIALMSTEYQLNVNRMSSFFSTKSTSENRIKKFRHFFIVKLFTKKRFNLNNLKSIQSNHDTNERILFIINNNNSLLWQTFDYLITSHNSYMDNFTVINKLNELLLYSNVNWSIVNWIIQRANKHSKFSYLIIWEMT